MTKSYAWRLVPILAITTALLVLTDAFASKQADAYKQLDVLVDIRHELVDSYVEEPDQMQLVESAVAGMIASLDDPYTVFVPAEEARQFTDRLTGSFSGIGAEIDMYEGRPRIVTPLEDSPAWKAGIMAGDVILKVDGESTKDKSQNDVIQNIKGEPGTDVVLTVRRKTGEELDITVTRDHINVQTVRGFRRQADQSFDYMLDPINKIGYIRISQFTEPTADELRAALQVLKAQDVKGLIIDLRFDPGGLLSSAVAVSDMFLTEGKRIVSTKGRKAPEQVYNASADTILPNTPLVILANEGSASASEVVTGALTDNDRALFVGTRTLGKGSVQQVRELENGLGVLKMTNAYYYLPNGRNIHRRPNSEVWGVDPDEGAYVPMTFDEYEEMIITRRDADVISDENGHADMVTITPEYIKDHMKDPQLAAALRAVRGKIETDDWPVVGLSDAEELVRQHERELLQRRRSLLLEELERVETELADGKAEEEAMEPNSVKLPEELLQESGEATEEQLKLDKQEPVKDGPAEVEEAVEPKTEPALESEPAEKK